MKSMTGKPATPVAASGPFRLLKYFIISGFAVIAVVTFLLGAGASKPAPSGIPTVSELLRELLIRARRLDRDDVTKLADFCKARDINNIEDLLTAVQLATFCSRNAKMLRRT